MEEYRRKRELSKNIHNNNHSASFCAGSLLLNIAIDCWWIDGIGSLGRRGNTMRLLARSIQLTAVLHSTAKRR